MPTLVRPPFIDLLNVRDIGDTYVSFSWKGTRPSEVGLNFHYELLWKPLGKLEAICTFMWAYKRGWGQPSDVISPATMHNPILNFPDATKLVLPASQQR